MRTTGPRLFVLFYLFVQLSWSTGCIGLVLQERPENSVPAMKKKDRGKLLPCREEVELKRDFGFGTEEYLYANGYGVIDADSLNRLGIRLPTEKSKIVVSLPILNADPIRSMRGDHVRFLTIQYYKKDGEDLDVVRIRFEKVESIYELTFGKTHMSIDLINTRGEVYPGRHSTLMIVPRKEQE